MSLTVATSCDMIKIVSSVFTLDLTVDSMLVFQAPQSHRVVQITAQWTAKDVRTVCLGRTYPVDQLKMSRSCSGLKIFPKLPKRFNFSNELRRVSWTNISTV